MGILCSSKHMGRRKYMYVLKCLRQGDTRILRSIHTLVTNSRRIKFGGELSDRYTELSKLVEN
jgi:hypothetical protein